MNEARYSMKFEWRRCIRIITNNAYSSLKLRGISSFIDGSYHDFNDTFDHPASRVISMGERVGTLSPL